MLLIMFCLNNFTPNVVSQFSFIPRTPFYNTESMVPNYRTLQYHKISDIDIVTM